jgi:hypothetical protein
MWHEYWHVTGMLMAFSIVSALFDRARTGKGRRLQVAMQDSVMHYSRGHRQLKGPRAPFCGPARLERGSTIDEQRTFRPEPPRHRHNEHTTGG